MTTMAEPCDKCGKLDANQCEECNKPLTNWVENHEQSDNDRFDDLWLYRKNLHNGELMPQLRDFARAVLAAASARAELAASGEPIGWKLVPIQLTREMYDATHMVKEAPFDLWKRLLNAAPNAPISQARETIPSPDADEPTAMLLNLGYEQFVDPQGKRSWRKKGSV